jgi:uncharacterized protein YbaR (Trm112 family)
LEVTRVSLPPGLLELIACPGADHAPLEVDKGPDGPLLICTVCLSEFRIEDGIPVLLIDEAKPGPNGVGVPA